ncbi:hypothetical protein RchiOBHm_Chr6g0268921 [Rosa chinensis]|uniref:Uncharacterized protein n=1 Tax=Rosa chinensis TaxID=74649 RepID=A0A2P6PQC2_ROSCH|nr:hypothetical protein RchiOBHm_Chr6g0268921 [Rosa chinensis]
MQLEDYRYRWVPSIMASSSFVTQRVPITLLSMKLDLIFTSLLVTHTLKREVRSRNVCSLQGIVIPLFEPKSIFGRILWWV